MPKQQRDVPPLSEGKTAKEMLLILGHCRFAGIDSPEAEACCRSQGIELADLQAFDRWYEESGGVVFASEEDETRALGRSGKGTPEALKSASSQGKAIGGD